MGKRDYLKYLGFTTSAAIACSQTKIPPPMTNNTKLPVEFVNEIQNDAVDKFPEHLTNANELRIGYGAGATEYAIKLHEAQQENERLKADIEKVISFNESLSAQFDKCHKQLMQIQKERDELKRAKSSLEANEVIMILLLKEVFTKHESGLLPDRFIYEKIKTFLYGE